MGFYSIVVWTPVEIEVREKLLFLDPGTNTFNVQTDDVEAFIDRLKVEGTRDGTLPVRIVQVHQLDGLEAIPAEFSGLDEVPILPTGRET